MRLMYIEWPVSISIFSILFLATNISFASFPFLRLLPLFALKYIPKHVGVRRFPNLYRPVDKLWSSESVIRFYPHTFRQQRRPTQCLPCRIHLLFGYSFLENPELFAPSNPRKESHSRWLSSSAAVNFPKHELCLWCLLANAPATLLLGEECEGSMDACLAISFACAHECCHLR